jgi:hypothetical protein
MTQKVATKDEAVKQIFSSIFVTFERYVTNFSGTFVKFQYQPTLI